MQNKSKIKFSKKYIVLICILTISLITKITIWDNPNNKWLIEDIYFKPPNNFKGTVANKILLKENNVKIYDATNINNATAEEFYQPASTEEIKNIVQRAKNNKKTISISGARHSSNGQNLDSSIHLDINKYDQIISLNKQENTIKVQSGATWKQIQEYLGKENLAVKIMQDSNIFTVGGSIGNNVHGKDVRYGNLIESIKSIKIVIASGDELVLNRDENYALFKSVIGGQGMFGIITEVELFVTENTPYQYKINYINSSELVSQFEEKGKNSDMVEGHFSIDNRNLLDEVQLYYFTKTENKPANIVDDVSGENSVWLRKAIYRISRESDGGKQFRWWMQKTLSPIVEPEYTTRNSAMAAVFRTLELQDPNSTDVLQEYFVPKDKVTEFLKKYRELIRDNNQNLINCVVRKVNKDDEALVTYAPQEMYGFVCYYKISKNNDLNTDYFNFTSQMIDYLLTIDGKYYLAYDFFDNQDKILKMYPNIEKLLETKKIYDPELIFKNRFYSKFVN